MGCAVSGLVCTYIGAIKVNLEFTFSFSGFSFSGLDLFLKISVFTYFSPIADWFSTMLSNHWLRVWTFFSVDYCSLAQQQRIRGFKPGFKTQVFNSQFLTQTDISFSRFSDLKPGKGHFLDYFKRSYINYVFSHTTVKLGKKERFDKEHIKEAFPVTNLPFTSSTPFHFVGPMITS